MSHPSLPSTALLRQQAEWLAPARSRLLRRAGIARCRRVLDLGCGVGAVTAELARRTSGFVVALDRDRGSLLLTKPSRDREGAVEPATNALGNAEGDSPVFRSTYDEQ
ncbi:MAG TPA: hypothetical protein VJL29_07290, partial [Thermoguttaceae bacterium]|nr:hypothetical protein [Thermoguttaceae bacterium]